MSRINELRELFEKYDRDHLECDGATRVFSYLLKQRNIPHTIMGGRIEYRTPCSDESEVVEPHYWIELNDGFTIDFKARLWLPDREGVPHGIFKVSDYPRVLYIGEERNDFLISKVIFEILINDKHSDMS